MGQAIITSEGFVGQRLIVSDYFLAGTNLNAGDVVVFQQQQNPPYHPRVFKAAYGRDKKRIVGIVHTPPGSQSGDPLVSEGKLAPVVVLGIAQAFSQGKIDVGDPVSPSGGTRSLPFIDALIRDHDSQTATVKAAVDPNTDPVIGRALTPAFGSNQVIDVLVDVAGSFGG